MAGYIMIDLNRFQSQLNGLACTVVVTHYLAGTPDKISGPMEDAEEGTDEEFEFYLLDDRNIRAPWLDQQVTTADFYRILEEYYVTRLEFKHYINETD